MTEGRGERSRETPDITIHDPDDVIGGVAGGGSGERATGTPNTIYDLSSVLFHALEGRPPPRRRKVRLLMPLRRKARPLVSPQRRTRSPISHRQRSRRPVGKARPLASPQRRI